MTTPLKPKGLSQMAKAPAPDPAIGFLQLLQTHRRGEISTEADAALTDILTALREFGGAGKLTLTLKLKLNKTGQIELAPDLKTEKPRRAMSTGLFFADQDGRLLRRDPDQPDWVDEVAARRGEPEH
ncbi:MAG: hypothetical protein V4720_06365 [Pseudomonadota bacterium]